MMGVESVLDLSFCSSREMSGNLAPLMTDLIVQLEKERIFSGSPITLFDVWLELIEVSIPDLLSCSTVHHRGYEGPTLAIFPD